MALFGKGSKATDPVSLLKSGDYKAAIKLLEKKLQQAPKDFTTRLRLAEAYEGVNRKEDAARIYIEESEASLAGGSRAQGIALLRKAAKLKPEDAGLAERLASLEGAGSQAGGSGSFSFDMDMTQEAPPGEEPAEIATVSELQEDTPPPSEPAGPPGTPELPPQELSCEVPLAPDMESIAQETEVVDYPAEEPGAGSPPAIPSQECRVAPPAQAASDAAGDAEVESSLPDAIPQEATAEVLPADEAESAASGGQMPEAEDAPLESEGIALPVEAVVIQADESPPPGAASTGAPTPEGEAMFMEPEAAEAPTEVPEAAPSVIVRERLETVAEEVPSIEPPSPPPSRLLRPDDPAALMVELFPGIHPKEAQELREMLKMRRLSLGEILIREGDHGDSLFLVMEGSLEASGRFENTRLRLAVVSRCDVIGEVAFLKQVPRTATVLALEPSVVLELSRAAVTERFKDRPELLGRLEAILEERVQNTINALKQRWKGD